MRRDALSEMSLPSTFSFSFPKAPAHRSQAPLYLTSRLLKQPPSGFHHFQLLPFTLSSELNMLNITAFPCLGPFSGSHDQRPYTGSVSQSPLPLSLSRTLSFISSSLFLTYPFNQPNQQLFRSKDSFHVCVLYSAGCVCPCPRHWNSATSPNVTGPQVCQGSISHHGL